MLTKFGIEAGVNREGTSYSAEGYWYDSDKVRFRKGSPEKIGGWQKLSENTYLGVSRTMHNWSSFDNNNYMAIGTNRKAYIEIGGTYYDITPSRFNMETELGIAMTDSGTTSVTVKVTEDGIAVASMIRVDNEFMLVTSVGSGADANEHYDVVVTRAQLGSSNAAHASEAGVFETLVSPNPVGIVNASTTVLVKDIAHGAKAGDYVSFMFMTSDPSAGVLRASFLTGYDMTTSTQGFQIESVLDADHYEITVGATGSVGTPSTLGADLSVSSGTIDMASGEGTRFADNDVVKIGSEYIQLGTRGSGGTADRFSSCLRGQFGSERSSHSSGIAVNDLKTTATGTGTASFDGGNSYLLYDTPSGVAGYAGSSGFGAGAFTGRPDVWVQSSLTSPYSAGAVTMAFASSQFSAAGSLLVGADTSTYIKSGGSGVASVVHVSGPAEDYSINQTVYDVTASWFGWGEAATSTSDLATWSLDNFGEDLVLARQGGVPYYWDASASTNGAIPLTIIATAGGNTNNGLITGKAVPMSSIGSSTYIDSDGVAQATQGHGVVPTKVRKMMVWPERQLILAFGTTDIAGVYKPMLLRWSDATKPGSWFPTEANDSGGEPLSSGSYIVSACKAKREMIVWTDESMYSMQHNSDFVFGFTLIANGVSIVGSSAFAEADNSIFWMGDRNFYVYQSGSLSTVPCTVLEYVFGNLNYGQREKIFAASSSLFGEVTFYYPSAGSEEIDRYVTYNYSEGAWSIGAMSRTAWSDSGIREKPEACYMIDSSGNTSLNYVHELGHDADGIAMPAYIQSAYMDLGDGEDLMLMSRIVPDVRLPSGGGINVIINKQDYPNGAVTSVSYAGINGATLYKNVRIRARQVSIKFESTALGVGWHLGDFRYEVQPDGRV